MPERERDADDEPTLAEARRLLEAGDQESSFELVSEYWLANPLSREAALLMSEIMKELKLDELSHHLSRLASSPLPINENPQSLFEAGYRFIDHRLYALAEMLLSACANLAPAEPMVNYELAFALMSLKRFAEAIPYFEKSIAGPDDFDTRLNLVVCYISTRQDKKAADMIARLAKIAREPDQKQALSHQKMVLHRLRSLPEKKSLSARDWLFVQYGSVLLDRKADREGSGPVLADYQSIAEKLITLRDFLDGLGESFEVVEYYSVLSRPLAIALAELMGIASDSYRGDSRVERALTVMAWASDLIGPHQAFAANEHRRSLFAFGLTSEEPLPIIPDLVAVYASSCAMPWAERWQVESDGVNEPVVTRIEASSEGPEEIAARIVAKARAIESDPDLIRQANELVEFYSSRRELMVLGNHETFPLRPEYTAEVPP